MEQRARDERMEIAFLVSSSVEEGQETNVLTWPYYVKTLSLFDPRPGKRPAVKIPSQGSWPRRGGTKNKKRNRLTIAQRLYLENGFRSNPYPSQSLKFTLSAVANITYRQVQIWFQNRRRRDKVNRVGW
jgi:hypothetical protein